jgi:syntaxin-binding protein 1
MNVKEGLKQHIIELLNVSQKYKVLVVDPESLVILDNTLKMADILTQNVTSVQGLYKQRQPSEEAIYFVSPTMNSVNQIIQDGRKQLYQVFHVYFITGLSDALFDKLRGARLNIKTLKELQLDFICPDPNYFSLETPDSFMNLYNPEAPSLLQYELKKTAKKICSVLVQLGEYPHIRYSTKPQAFHTTPQKSLTSELAFLVQNELDLIASHDKSFPPETKYPRATLLLVDRKADCFSPLIHDIHYQAMLADLGSMHCRKITDEEGKEYLLDETDLFWPQVRNWHISQVMDFVTEKFAKFKEENKAAQWELGGGQEKNIQQLKDVVTSFGDYQQTKDVVARHVTLCSLLSKTFSERGLEPLVDLEQKLAIEGSCKQKELEKVISDPNIQYLMLIRSHDKVILMMLYIIYREGITDKERQHILDVAKLSIEEVKAITNFGQLGVRLSPSMEKRQDDRV